MGGTAAKVERTLAKVLGIKLAEEDDDPVTRGESVFSMQTSDSFIEGPPTTSEWLHDQLPTRAETVGYVRSLFPFISWLPHYNLQWLAGDLVAGITIGAVLVPQGMAYALLANLPPQFGLYSSFMGPITYWIFGTSKDISIGPVAVLSTVVGTVVADVNASGTVWPANVVATAFAVIAGCIVLALGVFRLGWIVDLISITSLSAFMTGSAITIGASQLPSLFGLTGFSSRDAAYRVIINTLKHLPETKLDAAIGLTALFLLYLIRYTLTRAAERWPANKRIIFFLNTMRTVFVILLYTMISWLINRHRKDDPAIRVLGVVPKGFKNAGVPEIEANLVSKFASHLPAGVIVMLVEHIAISKSFGRVNNYTIDPSQEMVAIAAVLIYRILKARGRFLGKVKVHSVIGDHVIGDHHKQLVGEYGTFEEREQNAARNIFLPLDHGDGSNPEVELENPYPGIFIYRFSEGFNYPSANHALEYLTSFIYARTRRTSPEIFERKGDRPWNNAGQRKSGKSRADPDLTQKPTLKAIILDFSSVNNVDITSVQRLIDVRNVLDTYAAPDVVDWHIACINNRWTKRALVAGGFGTPTKPQDGVPHRWKSIFSVAEIGGKDSAAAVAEENAINRELSMISHRIGDEEMAKAKAIIEEEEQEEVQEQEQASTPSDLAEKLGGSPKPAFKRKGAIISGFDKPLFHVDLTSAVLSAIANVEARLESTSST
ncbi:sulfate permease 2 [Trichoderma asperellum]|uniref:Sulfate permease 2 n=1 Tax=Trichoderma asperellum TaxID=101201 RepID=A0A6V8QJW5_TRIAP|nr:sulfate permease 2 [Trichoderma asperellum]